MMEVPFHYQFRIIVIGDTMVGKSSLLKTFSEGTFGEMEPTVGVDFFSKIIEIRPKNRAFETGSNRLMSNSHHASKLGQERIIIKLQIWDTAGQERFKSIVTSYYRNSVGIVLVYDVTNRESYDHLRSWFLEARRHVEPSPSPTLSPITQNQSSIRALNYPITSTPNISQNKHQTRSNNIHNNGDEINANQNNSFNHNSDFSELSFNSFSERQSLTESESFKMAYLVLGCKTDLKNQRQVSYEDGQAFADMYGFKFIETSSKTHYNVDQAFQILAEEIYDKISEWGRSRRLQRTASGSHITLNEFSSYINEGIRLGPLIENTSRLPINSHGVSILEAKPVAGFMGGCC